MTMEPPSSPGQNSFAPSWLDINLKQLHENLASLKQKTTDDVQFVAVVKANAYGHGAIPISRSLEGHVDKFAVAHIDEAIELRNAGINAPIIVLAPPESSFTHLYKTYKLEAVVSDLEQFNDLHSGTYYHLQFDTGMKRLGIDPRKIEEAVDKVNHFRELHLTGIMSHFATADEPGSEKVDNQNALFKDISAYFRDRNVSVHIANTGGLAFYPQSHQTMVRLGISLYGYQPESTPISGIAPILTWNSYIIQSRPIQKNETVSYGATWTAEEDGYILTIPAGYADGIPRILSNNMEVWVGGKRLPQVGTITMDYIMVYSPQPIETGTPVTILSPHGPTASDWAKATRTISYEIVTHIGSRVERRYHS